MTYEQYYWFIRRQQLLNAWNRMRVGGNSGRVFKFIKTDCPYLFYYESFGEYDEDMLNADFETYSYQPLAGGRCSSARRGKYHGRNYDWYFDQSPSIVVKTPVTSTHKHATLGVAKVMNLNASEVRDGWDPRYKYLEASIVDGINDAGLACNLNVVPPGDNPNYPTIADEDEALQSGIPEEIVRNITYGTSQGKPRRFIRMICRTILDNCATTDEVKNMLNDYSWYAARNKKQDFYEEFHAMVSDKDKTIVIEFIENRPVVHEWKADGAYIGCSDENFRIGDSGVLPVMTNFYLSNWDGNLDNLGIKEAVAVANRNPTVTTYGMGYERYTDIVNRMKDNPDSWSEDEFMLKLMQSVRYRQAYDTRTEKEWASEFLNRSDGETNLGYRDDMLNNTKFIKYRQTVKELVEKEDDDNRRGIRPLKSESWQTVHNSTYDIENKTLTVCAQEKYENKYTFAL